MQTRRRNEENSSYTMPEIQEESSCRRLHHAREIQEESSRDYTMPERSRKQRPPAKAPGNGKVQAFQ